MSFASKLTESKSQKQERGSNQKYNFKYLMNSKTNRSTRNIEKDKQNDVDSVVLSKAHKYANKTARIKTCYNQSTKVLYSLHDISHPYNKDHQNNQECSKVIKRFQYDDTLGNDSQIIEKIDNGCMTEECYSVKELQIKTELLKKQRDDMWNSITQIVKQNQYLKSAKQNRNDIEIQTQKFNQYYGIQTDFQQKDWQRITTEKQRLNQQICEAKQFCQQFMLDKNETEEYNLKSLLSQAISQSISKLTLQFKNEKDIFQEMHHSQVSKQSHLIESYKQKINKIESELKELTQTKTNMQKIYEKEIEDIRKIVSEKQNQFNGQISKLTVQLNNFISSNEETSKNYMQYIQSLNHSWLQKQKVYSTLLSDSHRTINGLMSQMKQFESLANTNYTKYINLQRQSKSSK